MAVGTGEASSGITTRTFKSGSIIYFDGDRSDNIFILKAGRVILTSIKLDTKGEVVEEVSIGEFFGVKSALGKYPREETAQAFGETTLLVLRPADFERLVLKNVNLVRKMLQIFSNQLRRIHSMVRNEMGQNGKVDPGFELFNIGEYYYKTGVYQQALYAYKKSLEHYPDTAYADKAMQRIMDIESGNVSPARLETSGNAGDDGDYFEDDSAATNSFDSGGSSDFDDFGSSLGLDGAGEYQSELSSDLDDFLSEDDGLSDFDDFSMDEPYAEKTAEEKLADASVMLQEGRLDEAGASYKELIDSGELSDEQTALAYVEMGVCNAKQNKIKEAGVCFNTVIKSYSASSSAKRAFFEIGNILLAASQKEKAAAYYKKVVAMQPKDSVTDEAAKLLKQISG